MSIRTTAKKPDRGKTKTRGRGTIKGKEGGTWK
jgi:hypothetical protein